MKFLDIQELSKIEEQKWYIKRGLFHFKIKTETKAYIFCSDNESIVNYWVE